MAFLGGVGGLFELERGTGPIHRRRCPFVNAAAQRPKRGASQLDIEAFGLVVRRRNLGDRARQAADDAPNNVPRAFDPLAAAFDRWDAAF